MDGVGLFRTIKKPACGRLLGDWFSLFLVNLTSLQIVHPDSHPGDMGHQRELLRIARQGGPASRQPPTKCAADNTHIRLNFPAPDPI